MQTSRDFLPAVVAALTFALTPQSRAAKTSDAAALAPVRPTAGRTCCAAVDELSGVLLKRQGDSHAVLGLR